MVPSSHGQWRPNYAVFLIWVAVVSISAPGCSFYRDKVSTDRLDRGLTLVLPGIEGASMFNGNIARGLESAEVETAIEIDDWTSGWAPLFLVHLRDSHRHQDQAERLAQKIVDYQTVYPGRPVYLIGHSGGGAMALLTLEKLPEPHRVTAVFLLAPAISPGFPVDALLSKTERGIWNYYSALDAPLLIAGTSLAGTVDGKLTPAAGAVGFQSEQTEPIPTNDRVGENRAGPRLYQIPYSPVMLNQRHWGGHLGWTDPLFVRKHIAPVIRGAK